MYGVGSGADGQEWWSGISFLPLKPVAELTDRWTCGPGRSRQELFLFADIEGAVRIEVDETRTFLNSIEFNFANRRSLGIEEPFEVSRKSKIYRECNIMRPASNKAFQASR